MQPALKLSTTLCGLGSMEGLYITTTSLLGQTCRLVAAAQLELFKSWMPHYLTFILKRAAALGPGTQQSRPALYLVRKASSQAMNFQCQTSTQVSMQPQGHASFSSCNYDQNLQSPTYLSPYSQQHQPWLQKHAWLALCRG